MCIWQLKRPRTLPRTRLFCLQDLSPARARAGVESRVVGPSPGRPERESTRPLLGGGEVLRRARLCMCQAQPRECAAAAPLGARRTELVQCKRPALGISPPSPLRSLEEGCDVRQRGGQRIARLPSLGECRQQLRSQRGRQGGEERWQRGPTGCHGRSCRSCRLRRRPLCRRGGGPRLRQHRSLRHFRFPGGGGLFTNPARRNGQRRSSCLRLARRRRTDSRRRSWLRRHNG